MPIQTNRSINLSSNPPEHDSLTEASRANTLREGRSRYFAENGFPPDGGYNARWVRVDVGWLPLAFPNTQARVRAVKYHDLHHVMTGYATHWRGEAEIGAWEVGSNCRGYWAAWLLNLWAMWSGLCFAPRPIWRAFLRGRRSRNLYGTPFDDALLDSTVCATRTRLGLDREPLPARPSDRLAFAATTLLATLAVIAPLVVLVALVALAAIAISGL